MKLKPILYLALILSGGGSICFADLPSGGTNANNGFQLETKLDLVEKVTFDAALPGASWTNGVVPWFVLDEALGELDTHHSLWSSDSSIPPRLSKAVLTVFPSLENASIIDPFLRGEMWCHAIKMLVKTHDPAMVSVLRPYLKEKDLAEDTGTVGYGITTMRICDEAALAINSLLNLKLVFPHSWPGMFLTGSLISTNGTNVVRWSSHFKGVDEIWSGQDPAWEEWDKKIAELQKTLDALAENKGHAAVAK